MGIKTLFMFIVLCPCWALAAAPIGGAYNTDCLAMCPNLNQWREEVKGLWPNFYAKCSNCPANSRIVCDFDPTRKDVSDGRCPNCYPAYNEGSQHCCNVQTYCICNPGWYRNGDSCSECVAGTYKNRWGNNACPACAPGHWSYAGQERCVACTVGQFAPNLQISPSIGVPGSPCYQCPGGYILSGGTCAGCPRDTYSSAGSVECTQCDPGYGSVTPTGYCTVCPAGKVSFHASNKIPDAPNLCDRCPDSYFPVLSDGFGRSTRGGSECQPCAENLFSKSGDWRCTACANGYYRRGSMPVCCTFLQYYANSCQNIASASFEIVNGKLQVVGADMYVDGYGIHAFIQEANYQFKDAVRIEMRPCRDTALTCGNFAVQIGCGPIQSVPFENIVVRLNNMNRTIAQWRVLKELDKNIATGQIVRGGACFSCAQCDPGFYNPTCKDGNFGECMSCRSSCPAGQYRTHRQYDGCNNTYAQKNNQRVATSLAQSDYDCNDCVAWRRTGFLRYVLLAGCVGNAVFDRWHPRAEADGDTLEQVTCTLGDTEAEACYYNDELIEKAPQVDSPGGVDLARQGYTAVLPYCPPGWRVDINKTECAFLAGGSTSGTEEWTPTCCRRCTVCEYGRRRAAEWRACSGFEAIDTQTCVEACPVGQYTDTDASCKRCRTCGVV